MKRSVIIGLVLASVALAQGERVITPLESFDIPDPRDQLYIGSKKLRFVYSPSFYPSYLVVGQPASIYFMYAGTEAKALRLTPVTGGSSLRIPLTGNNVPVSPSDYEFQNSPAALGEPTFRAGVVINSADFGVNAGGSISYRAELLDAAGKAGESVQISLNFRAKSDFVTSPRYARAKESLRQVVPIGVQQNLGDTSGAVYSIEVFETYSRVRTSLRFGRNADARYNQQFIPQALAGGALTASDDTGQQYVFSVENEEISVNSQLNSLEIPLTMTPALKANAKSLVLKFDPSKSPNADALLEPFKSGLSVPLTLKR
jgi:hypothetical protein